jgi:hypothetical protein
MFDQKLVDFFSSSTPKSRGFFTKALLNNTPYQSELVVKFRQIQWQKEISLSEKYWLLAHNQSEVPKCKNCNEDTVFVNGNYQTFCSHKCYTDYSMKDNNPSAKKIAHNETIYNSIIHAATELSTTRYLILEECMKDGNFRFYPNHEEQKEKIWESYPDALKDKETLLQYKKARIPLYRISEILGVKFGEVCSAFNYHKIDRKFEQISEEAKAKLLDPEYVKSILDVPVQKTMKELGVSASSVINYIRFHGFTYVNKERSYEQTQVFEYVKSLGFDDAINNDRTLATSIHPKELDINIPSKKIAIEFNGVYWHREQEEKHYEKYKICRDKGIRLIQIFEDDWIHNQDLIKRKIAHVLGVDSSKKIYARQCEVKTLTNKDVRLFLELNHIQGHKNCKEVYGLIFEDEIVAVITFNGDKLERFATSCNVVGGFSKLLKHSGKSYIETFADLCWSDEQNNVYTKNGFELKSISKPNYYWVMKSKRESRIAYQKHKLTKFKSYSKDKTEMEIMYEEGAYRIFDAGNAKLVYHLR